MTIRTTCTHEKLRSILPCLYFLYLQKQFLLPASSISYFIEKIKRFPTLTVADRETPKKPADIVD